MDRHGSDFGLSVSVILKLLRRGLAVFAVCLAPWTSDLARASELSPAAQTHMAAAQQALARKDYALAEREYRSVLALEPGFAEAAMNLGLIDQLQNHLPEAMSQFREALKLKPELAGANFFLGVDYCKLGQGAAALPYLKAVARLKPSEPGVWSWLATAQELSGRIPGEIETLQQGLRLQPRDIDLLYLLGRAYERLSKDEVERLKEAAAPGSSYLEQVLAEGYGANGQWAAAEVHLQSALASAPTRGGVRLQLGEVFLRSGNLRRAGEEFDAELALDPASLQALVRRGEVRLIGGNLEGALADWSEAARRNEPEAELILGVRETGFGDSAIEQLPESMRADLASLGDRLPSAPGSSSSHLALAFVSSQLGDPVDAAAEASEARHLASALPGPSGAAPNAGSPDATATGEDGSLALAGRLFESGDYDAALRALAGVPAKEFPEVSYWRARCYKKLAMAAYLKLYQIDPDSYRVHELLGDLDAARGEDAQAIQEYRAALNSKPDLPNLHYSAGHLLWKNLNVTEARVQFNRELALDPRHLGALEDMGATYLFEHQPDRALPYLRRALQIGPHNTGVHHDLGRAYAQLREYPKAEAELKAAASADQDGTVHYELAKVYQALGQKDEAGREFAISNELNHAAHRRAEERAERLGQANDTMRQ